MVEESTQQLNEICDAVNENLSLLKERAEKIVIFRTQSPDAALEQFGMMQVDALKSIKNLQTIIVELSTAIVDVQKLRKEMQGLLVRQKVMSNT